MLGLLIEKRSGFTYLDEEEERIALGFSKIKYLGFQVKRYLAERKK